MPVDFLIAPFYFTFSLSIYLSLSLCLTFSLLFPFPCVPWSKKGGSGGGAFKTTAATCRYNYPHSSHCSVHVSLLYIIGIHSLQQQVWFSFALLQRQNHHHHQHNNKVIITSSIITSNKIKSNSQNKNYTNDTHSSGSTSFARINDHRSEKPTT